MKNTREATMEDVNAACAACINRLGELKVIDADDPKHDKLFDELSTVLEKYFNYPDYANYN